MDGQLDLFPNLKVKRTRASKEYGAFTDKFKTKLTTDDCYTPEPVYNAVRDWTVKEFGLEGREIVRPFWPGGDFETFDYPPALGQGGGGQGGGGQGGGTEKGSSAAAA